MKIEERDNKLVITDFNELEAYKIARRIEKHGRQFYEKLHERAEEPAVKDMLGFLKEEEERHLAFFEERLDSVREEKEDYFEEDDMLDAMDFGIYHPYEQDLKKLEDILDNKKRVLELGLKIEQRAIDFYKACKDKVGSAQTRDHLQSIIEQEEKHKSLIQEQQDRQP
jgi:rubrerythrin